MKNNLTFNPYKPYKSLCTIIVSVILAILFFLSPFFSLPIAKAVTDATVYSKVLDDLKTDPTFDETLYPGDSTNYGFEIITIAESEAKELFLYVYQPADATVDFEAKYINMSLLDPDEGADFHIYELELVNSEGVFDKYVVKDYKNPTYNFVTSSDIVRFYNIASIYRPFLSAFDEGLPDYNDNTLDYKAFAIAKCFVASTVDDTVEYSFLSTLVVDNVNFYHAQIHYSDGIYWFGVQESINQFVSFSSSFEIDELISAKVFFNLYDCEYTGIVTSFPPFSYDATFVGSQTPTIRYDDVQSQYGGGLFSKNYSWTCITDVESFLADDYVAEHLDSDAKKMISEHQWVIRFFVSPLKISQSGLVEWNSWQEARNVSLIQFTVRTNGKLLTLGVVSNMQTGDVEPELYYGNYLDDILKILGTILAIFGLAVLGIYVGPFIQPVLNIIWSVIKWTFNAIVWIICAPFRFIYWLFTGKRRKKKPKPKTKKKNLNSNLKERKNEK